MNRTTVTIDDMHVGLRATHRVTIDQAMIDDYARLTDDYNPIHVDAEYAAGTPFGSTIAHGMLTAGFVQHALTALTTPGGISTVYHFELVGPVPAGTEVEASAECYAVDRERRRARFRLEVRTAAGDPLVEGDAEIAFPRRPPE